jgi:hypothetical protein
VKVMIDLLRLFAPRHNDETLLKVLCSCEYDVNKAADALLEGLDKKLLGEWHVIGKHGKGKVRAVALASLAAEWQPDGEV